jgi:hypothetical protein
MSSSPWECLWNRDEDVASPLPAGQCKDAPPYCGRSSPWFAPREGKRPTGGNSHTRNLHRDRVRVRVRVRVPDRTAGSTSFSIPMAIPIPIPTRAAGATARAHRRSSPCRPGISPMGNRLGIGVEWKPSPPAADRAHSSPTPTALRLLAQGWPRHEAYPGSTSHTPSNRNAVVACLSPVLLCVNHPPAVPTGPTNPFAIQPPSSYRTTP